MELDFRKLPFEGYELDTKMYSDETEAWFNRIDNKLEGLHIYMPEETIKKSLEFGQHEIIVAVDEILPQQEPYTTLIDLEKDVGVISFDDSSDEKEIYKKLAGRILQKAFEVYRKLEVYV